MKIKPGTPLEVRLDFGNANVNVGRLALDRGIAVFEPSDQGMVINPQFPPEKLIRAGNPRAFDGLHGVFADSLPDAWGSMLIQRRAERAGISYSSLTVLDKLAIVGTRGMGALTYHPEVAHPDVESSVDLETLAFESEQLLQGAASDFVAQLEELGGSSGGARPKVLVGMNDADHIVAGARELPDGFDSWLVKFRTAKDFPDIGPLEAAYAQMARTAGVEISDTKLIATKKGPGYFATRRFDRLAGKKRLHVASAAGILDTEWFTPTIDYDDLLKLTMYLTRNYQDVVKVFRRMVFNVLAHNRDDHAKQHAFLLDASGNWRAAPSYDLTFSYGPGKEHYLAVNGKGTEITRSDIRKLGAKHNIDAKETNEIIERTLQATQHFPHIAKDFGVHSATVKIVKTGLESVFKGI